MSIEERRSRPTKLFPATELTSSARPVRAEEMKEQRVYFVVQYLGNSGLVPILRPVMFLGYLERENPNLRFFQDYDSFIAGVRYDTADASEYEGAFEAYGPDEGKQMFEYEHALHVLMNCALRRRETADVDAEILAQSQERHV